MPTSKAPPDDPAAAARDWLTDPSGDNKPIPPPPPQTKTVAEQQQGEHSNVMGGSTADQRIHCPGSYILELNMPEDPPSSYAIQGSVFHAAMELMLAANPDTDEEYDNFFAELIGNDLGFGDEYQITKAQINSKILPAWNAWLDICDEYEIVDYFIEQRCSLNSVVDGAFGTVDVLGIDKAGRMHVLDWKFGDGVVVPVEGNSQLLFYAACALYDEDPEVIEMFSDEGGDDV